MPARRLSAAGLAPIVPVFGRFPEGLWNMNKAHLMDDPFYSAIMFRIESRICDADVAARKLEIELTDSNIKSCLNKVKILARGEEPKVEPRSERECFIVELALAIDEIGSKLREAPVSRESPDLARSVNAADWLLAVEAVEDSLKNHTSPGTRFYLDFLKDFIADARNEERKLSGNTLTRWWTRVVQAVRDAATKRKR